MTDREMTEEERTDPQQARLGSVRNSGDPILLPTVTPLVGVAAASALPGDPVKLWTNQALTSDDPAFHLIAKGLVEVIQQETSSNGVTCPPLDAVRTLLYIIRENGSGELWLDTAAVALKCVMKKSVAVATVIFEQDIADQLEMYFPQVVLGPTDRFLCIFREGWRFGMAFDFSEGGKADVQAFFRSLGRLHRHIRYHQIYTAIETPELFDKMCAAGWFPFAEIITSHFQSLLLHLREGWSLEEPERNLLTSFDKERIDHLYGRWTLKPHLAKRSLVLREALDAFVDRRPIAVIKILATEIEGFLRDAHRAATGTSAKEKVVVQFAIDSALSRTGGEESLMLPGRFAVYLQRNTYANFDPEAGDGTAGSRHAVGHGVAASDSYTMTRALQMILTVDQLAFFT